MQQSHIKPCPECGGKRVQVNAHVQNGYPGHGDGAIFLTQPLRSSGFLSYKNVSATTAFVCINCGYTALYAFKPENLVPDENIES